MLLASRVLSIFLHIAIKKSPVSTHQFLRESRKASKLIDGQAAQVQRNRLPALAEQQKGPAQADTESQGQKRGGRALFINAIKRKTSGLHCFNQLLQKKVGISAALCHLGQR